MKAVWGFPRMSFMKYTAESGVKPYLFVKNNVFGGNHQEGPFRRLITLFLSNEIIF